MGGFDTVAIGFNPEVEGPGAMEGRRAGTAGFAITGKVVALGLVSLGDETGTGLTIRGVSDLEDDSESSSGIGEIANVSEVGLKIRFAAFTALSCKVSDWSMPFMSQSSTISSTSESISESGKESSRLLSKKETLSLTRSKLYSPFWSWSWKDDCRSIEARWEVCSEETRLLRGANAVGVWGRGG